MNRNLKNFLGIGTLISVLFLGYSALVYTNSYSKSVEPGSLRSFSVSGEGRITGIPDVAEFNFSIITEGGENLAELEKENTEKTNNAIEFVKSNGVETKDIRTENYNINPRYKNSYCPGPVDGGCPPPEIVGYTINQTISVKSRDFSKTGIIISGIIKNGANSVSNLLFKLDDPVKTQNEARAKAVTQAKEKAKLIAEAGGFKIGRLLSIDENAPPIFYGYEVLGKGGDSGFPSAPAPTVEPGSQEITVNVFLRYEIQ